MMALVKAATASDYPAEIIGVISDKADAGGLAKAAAEGIATFAFVRKDFASKDAHEEAILAQLDALSPDIICLAGYMRLLSGRFIQRYEGRIINIHPSLLPLFFLACTRISARRCGPADRRLHRAFRHRGHGRRAGDRPGRRAGVDR